MTSAIEQGGMPPGQTVTPGIGVAAEDRYGLLSHAPTRPPRNRKHHPAEHAYLTEWRKIVLAEPSSNPLYMEDEDLRTGRLGEILCNLPARLTDRHSRIAANFIVWLGTNCGKSILRADAPYMRSKGIADTCFAAWSRDNQRRSFVNGGYRISDYLTSPDWQNPEICTDAIEVELFDFLAQWLDTGEGQAFIGRAEALTIVYQKGLSDDEAHLIAKAVYGTTAGASQ